MNTMVGDKIKCGILLIKREMQQKILRARVDAKLAIFCLALQCGYFFNDSLGKSKIIYASSCIKTKFNKQINIKKIFQVCKVKQMFADYISLDFGIVNSIHICRICSMQCSSNGMHKLFSWHISNGCRFWKVLWKRIFNQMKWVQLFVFIMIKPILSWV